MAVLGNSWNRFGPIRAAGWAGKFHLIRGSHIIILQNTHMEKHNPSFEWDDAKDRSNIAKHGIGFALAQRAFLDPNRIIAENLRHSAAEKRYFCIGAVDGEILTVRFTWRSGKIRIFGAGYWRKGKQLYEEERT